MENNLKNKLTTKDIINEFKLNIINEDKADLNKIIEKSSLSRAGLELQGFSPHPKYNIICWGRREDEWFDYQGKEKTIEAINNVFSEFVPLVILSKKISPKNVEIILEQANKFNIPISQVGDHLSVTIPLISLFLVKHFAPTVAVHGSLMIVNGIGLMIVGPSGVGKSEAVLELLPKNNFFISDDTVIVKRLGNDFFGEPAEITKGLLEARGIGIIDVAHIYGTKAMRDSTQLELVVELVKNKKTEFDRLGNKMLKYEILDGFIPKIQIPVQEGRSLSTLIEAAANVFLIKKNQIDVLETIKDKIKNQ